MVSPFEITFNTLRYFIFPDWDDFLDELIYGIEHNQQEIGILKQDSLGDWHWIEGGNARLMPNQLGKAITLQEQLCIQD